MSGWCFDVWLLKRKEKVSIFYDNFSCLLRRIDYSTTKRNAIFPHKSEGVPLASYFTHVEMPTAQQCRESIIDIYAHDTR